MSAEAIKQTRSQISEVVDWEPPMPPTDLIFDDGEPLETDRCSLQGWHLALPQGYQPLVSNQQGWLWCETLGFWLGTWEGTIDREPAVWLRFYDRNGNLILLPEEAAKAEAEVAKAEAQAAEVKAEAAEARIKQEHQRAERLAAQLRELGGRP